MHRGRKYSPVCPVLEQTVSEKKDICRLTALSTATDFLIRNKQNSARLPARAQYKGRSRWQSSTCICRDYIIVGLALPRRSTLNLYVRTLLLLAGAGPSTPSFLLRCTRAEEGCVWGTYVKIMNLWFGTAACEDNRDQTMGCCDKR